MIVLNILEENLPFLVIGLMIIVIVVVAYYTFIKPKPKLNSKDETKEQKETEMDQAIINQDSDKLEQTSNAMNTDEIDSEKEQTNELDDSKPVVVQKSDDEDDQLTKEDKETKTLDETETTELGKYHITYRQKDNKWIVTREGSEKTIRVLHTKKEAIAYATIKAINQDSNIVIHGRDGKIEKHGY